jgi:hypothetical protein
MSSEDLKRRVLAARLPKGTVTIEGVGEITVRGMSREEIHAVNERNEKADDGPMGAERRTLALTMIDPVMTEDEIGEWQRNSPAAEINAVAAEVNRLSGIGQAKERFPQV